VKFGWLCVLQCADESAQERRTYIPQGWSKFHEFSFADLRSTAAIISSCDTESPPWETIHGLLDNAIYGGRIDNVFDQRILRTCLAAYYSDQYTSGGGSQARPLPNTKISVPSTKVHAEFLQLVNQVRFDHQPIQQHASQPAARNAQRALLEPKEMKNHHLESSSRIIIRNHHPVLKCSHFLQLAAPRRRRPKP